MPKEKEYAGIDYSLGKSNFDTETGIHFGVISQHSVLQAWADSAEPDYDEPTCPSCTGKLTPANEEKDYYCKDCDKSWFSQDVFGDEPNGWTLDDGEYKACDCLDTDIMILKSPYRTYAQYCSPCVPGAGNLDHPICPENAEGSCSCYCFGHDWFDDGKAPYRVFRVVDGEEVLPEER